MQVVKLKRGLYDNKILAVTGTNLVLYVLSISVK